MCYLRPLKIKKIEGKRIMLENGIKAVYDRKVGELKENDLVMVYGNLVLQKIKANETKFN